MSQDPSNLPLPVAHDLGIGFHEDLYSRTLQRVQRVPDQDILELGTYATPGNPRTIRRNFAHPTSRYVGSDFQAGLDVDRVADIHDLPATFHMLSFDVVIACSVLEHVARPWVALASIKHVLRPGGWVYLQTHQTFVIHGYPHDYWRFTREALELLCTDVGLKVIKSRYGFPCKIVHDQPLGDGESFLNVEILAERPAHLPF